MDQSILATFKSHYLRRTMGQLVREIERDKMTIKEFWWGYNIKKALSNITETWNEVTASTRNAVWGKKSVTGMCPPIRWN